MSLRISSKTFRNNQITSFNILSFHTKLKDYNTDLFDDSSQRIFSANDCSNLYIFQGELAIVRPTTDRVQYVLTDDTTTCSSVIIRHAKTGLTCMLHCDQLDFDDKNRLEVSNLISKILEISSSCPTIDSNDNFTDNEFHLSILGGYLDERNISEQLFVNILRHFNSLNLNVIIDLRCVFTGSKNTKRVKSKFQPNTDNFVPGPKIYGAAIHISTGKIFNAVLDHSDMSNVPLELIRRSLIAFNRNFYWDVYDTINDCLRFKPRPLSFYLPYMKDFFESKLTLPESQILLECSTSPHVEPDHFVENLKASYLFFYENCEKNLAEEFFPNKFNRIFIVLNNKWTEIK